MEVVVGVGTADDQLALLLVTKVEGEHLKSEKGTVTSQNREGTAHLYRSPGEHTRIANTTRRTRKPQKPQNNVKNKYIT